MKEDDPEENNILKCARTAGSCIPKEDKLDINNMFKRYFNKDD